MQFNSTPVQQSSENSQDNHYNSTFTDQPFFDGGVQHFVYHTATNNKQSVLADILKQDAASNAIVYVKTNFASDSVAEYLNRAGITTEAVHENKSTRTRSKSLANFRSNLTRILVVTESSASALDIADISFFINYDLPLSAETFTQRVAQHPAIAKTFSLCDSCEKGRVKNINRVLSNKMKEIEVPCVSR